MSRVSDEERTRGYRPDFTVQYRGSQRQQQRFGANHKNDIRVMLEANDTEEYPDYFAGEWSDFPRIARLRLNLTALSQYYNLYFVAYRGYIHVYRPNRTPESILDKSPLVILEPNCSQTPMAPLVPGHVNRRYPHEVNHVKVGDLGDLEILLISRDNGDVVAWYTKDIARFADRRLQKLENGASKTSPICPRHFFADNVGSSAWGLAIHSASRLIAVSANTSEVTVFAFALENAEDDDGEDEDKEPRDGTLSGPSRRLSTAYKKPQGIESTMNDCDDAAKINSFIRQSMHSSRVVVDGSRDYIRRTMQKASDAAARLEKRFRKRVRTWRIIIPLGREASNLPSVAFCDDENGQADRVAAIDINGNLFIADIWRIGTKPLKVPPHNAQDVKGRRHAQVTGWNVLPITDAQLRPTRTLRAAIGMPPKNAVYRGKTARGAWLDISRGMAEVPNDAAFLRHRDRFDRFDTVDHSSDTDAIAPANSVSHLAVQMALSGKVYQPQFDENDNLDLGGDRPVRIAMTMVPVTGDHYCEFKNTQGLVDYVGAQASRRALRMSGALTLDEYRFVRGIGPKGRHLLHGVSFLRAYDDGAEILSLEPKEDGCGVVCHHVLTNVNLYRQRTYWDMQFSNRCSMLLTIPELNLVVLGSMCGRVALLTLTQPPPCLLDPRLNAPRTFRVEAVLPLDTEDEARERPYVCLLGMAVSPVPETRVLGLSLRKTRRAAYGGRKTRKMLPGAEAPAPKRWRLILNYMDHSILQYDIISRRQDCEEAEGIHVKKISRRRRRDTNSSSCSQGNWSEDIEHENNVPEFVYFSDDPDEESERLFVQGGQMADAEDSSEDDDEETDDGSVASAWQGIQIGSPGSPAGGQDEEENEEDEGSDTEDEPEEEDDG